MSRLTKKTDRQLMVEIGRQLCTVTEEDIKYILDESHSDLDVQKRMIDARRRSKDDYGISKKPTNSGRRNKK